MKFRTDVTREKPINKSKCNNYYSSSERHDPSQAHKVPVDNSTIPLSDHQNNHFSPSLTFTNIFNYPKSNTPVQSINTKESKTVVGGPRLTTPKYSSQINSKRANHYDQTSSQPTIDEVPRPFDNSIPSNSKFKFKKLYNPHININTNFDSK